MTLKNIIEALIFASQKPLMPHEIVQVLRSASTEEDLEAQAFAKIKEDEIATVLAELKGDYIQMGHAFQLVEEVAGWHLVSNPDCGKWVRQLYPESKPARLSGPALETLAIVAYRQPITKADIEAVRGVAVDGMMQMLLEKGLISIAGRSDMPGRPLLYQTTEGFLEHFGLRAVDELPNAAELRRINLPTAPIPEEAPKPEAAPELPLAEQAAPVSDEESAPIAEESKPAAEPAIEEEPAEEPVEEEAAPESEEDEKDGEAKEEPQH